MTIIETIFAYILITVVPFVFIGGTALLFANLIGICSLVEFGVTGGVLGTIGGLYLSVSSGVFGEVSWAVIITVFAVLIAFCVWLWIRAFVKEPLDWLDD